MLVANHGNTDIFSKKSAFPDKDKAKRAAKLMFIDLKSNLELTEREEDLLYCLIRFLMLNVNEELNVFLTISQIGDMIDEGRRYRINKLMKLLESEEVLRSRNGIITINYLEGSEYL